MEETTQNLTPLPLQSPLPQTSKEKFSHFLKTAGRKITAYFKRTWRLEWVIIFGAIFLDFITKFLIERFVVLNRQTITLIPHFLEVVYRRNYDAALGFNFWNFFGMFGENPTDSQARGFFIVFISITIAGFIAYMVLGNKNRKLFRIALSLIVGGALGNLICRIYHGAVVDWIQFRFFGLSPFGFATFPVFNLADSFLIIGVFVFMVYFFKDWSKDEKDRVARKKAKAEALAGGESIVGGEETIGTDASDRPNKSAWSFSECKAETIGESAETSEPAER